MMVFANMNLQARIERYKERGFQAFDAEIIILIEETAVALFKAFPNRFVLFGGASLLLFYESPRLSRDLDLMACGGAVPPSDEVKGAGLSSIQPIAETLGLGALELQKYAEGPDFAKHWVLANKKPLFSIDLTRIGGGVLETQIVKKNIADAPERTVRTPNENYLPFQKLETFLNRRSVKARDAFDIRLLLSHGAEIDKRLEEHLEDSMKMKEIDEEEIENRIRNITNKLCIAELRTVLPPAVFEELAKDEFEAIRSSLRRVFANWLPEVRDELDDHPNGRGA